MELGGLYLQDNKDNAPNSVWVKAKDIVIGEDGKSLRNEFGFKGESFFKDLLTNSTYEIRGQILGGFHVGDITIKANKVDIERKGIIIFVKNRYLGEQFNYPVFQVVLLLSDNDTINECILLTSVLNYIPSINHPIQGVFRYNSLGELIIVWNNGNEDESDEVRIMNVHKRIHERAKFIINESSILTRYLSVTSSFLSSGVNNEIEYDKKTALFAKFNNVVFNLNKDKSSTEQGYLKKGLYYVSLQYKISDLDYTSLNSYSRECLVSNNNWQPGTITTTEYTTMSLGFDLTNLDTAYQFYRIIVTCKTNGGTESYIFGEFSIDTDFILIDNLTDKEPYLDYNVIQPKFERVKTLDILDNKLLLANVKTIYNYNYQKFANSIKVEPAYSDNNAYDISINRKDMLLDLTMKSDEVYALYIHLHYKNGTISPGFHIPGIKVVDFAISKVENSIANNDLASIIEMDINDIKNYMLYQEEGHFDTDMRMWQNSNEFYPDTDDFDIFTVDGSGNPVDTGNTLRSKNVRHHKVPNLVAYARKDTPENILDTDNIVRFGIRLRDIPIPNDLRPLITGFSVSYAKRSYKNIRNVSTSPMLDWRYTDLYDYTAAMGYWHTTFPFELLEDNNFADVEINYALVRYETINHTNQLVLFNDSAFENMIDPPTYYYLDLGICFPTLLHYDSGFFTGNNNPYPILSSSLGLPVDPSDYMYPLSNRRYIIENNTAWLLGTPPIGVSLANEVWTAKHKNYGLVFQAPNQRYLRSGYILKYTHPGAPLDVYYAPPAIYDLYQFKDNVYNPFYEQELLNTGIFIPITTDYKIDSVELFEFDCFINMYNRGKRMLLSTGNEFTYWSEPLTLKTTFTNGSIAHDYTQITFQAESIYNYASREYKTGSTYPLYGGGNQITGNVAFIPSYLKSKHDLLTTLPYDPHKRYSYEFRNMILKSVTQNDETLKNQIRQFKATEYVLLSERLNDITKIISFNDTLFIICVDNTYVTDITGISSLEEISSILQQGIAGTTVAAQVGVPDSLKKPQPLLGDKANIVASNSRMACISTPYGVVVFNNFNKQLYLINKNKFEVLTDANVSKWFSDYFYIEYDLDNPITLTGFIVGYDDDCDRLFLTRINNRHIILNIDTKDSGYVFFDAPVDSIKIKCSVKGKVTAIHKYLDNTYQSETVNIIFDTANEYQTVEFSHVFNDDSSLRFINLTGADIVIEFYYGSEYENQTFSYNLKTKIWMCEHDYIPSLFINYNNRLYSFNNDVYYNGLKEIYTHNHRLNVAKYYEVNVIPTLYNESFADFLFNYDKTNVSLESLLWKTRLHNILNKNLTAVTETIDEVMIYNNSQCSGLVPINRNSEWFENNAKLVDGVWFFNDFDDVVIDNTLEILDNNGNPILTNVDKTQKDWFNKSKFTDTFMIVRLLYKNLVVSGYQKIMYINDIITNVRKSYR